MYLEFLSSVRRLGLSVAAGALALSPVCGWAIGDTVPAINAVYPSGVFAPSDVVTNSARWNGQSIKKVLNVKTHFGAVGNGTTDDSNAFIAMIDFVAAREQAWDDAHAVGDNCEEPRCQWVMYVPDGTYRITKTIQVTDTASLVRGIRLIGQSRSGTILKLDNNCAGFTSAASPKTMLGFSNAALTFNNWQGHSMLRNMTIDVGSGNSGAIGVDYFSANTGRIDNVTIKSSGTGFPGLVGLHLRIGIVHGYFSNLTIDGFDVGIKCVPMHMCNPTIEHVTLTNQKVAAIQALDGGASFRDVYSNQTRSDGDVCGVLLANDSGTAQGGAHVIVLDSTFSARAGTTQPAMNIAGTSSTDANSGHLFARGIDVTDYTTKVKKGGTTVWTNAIITEYVSDPVSKYTGAPTASMNLPIEDAPFVPWDTTTSHWACPDDFFGTVGGAGNGTTDDTAAAQAALNSGATVVYFPMQQYKITGILTVPATVQRIDLMATEFVGTAPTAYFDVATASSTPLLVQDINDGVTQKLVRLSANRTLVLDSDRVSTVVNNGTTGQRVYVNNGNKFLKGGLNLSNMKAWCRFLNTEDKSQPNWIVDSGGVMWVLGFKCEGATVNYQVQGGGILEVLGGIMNQANGSAAEWDDFNNTTLNPPPNNAANVNLSSHLSLVACTSGLPDTAYPHPRRFDNLIGDKEGTSSPVMFAATSFPIRTATNPNRPNLRVVPLYNSYTNSAIPRAPVFSSDPISKADALSGTAYSGTLSGSATDANGDTISYSVLSGPSWLAVATNGALSGTPADSDMGMNTWTVKATDPSGYSDTATLKIDVYVQKTFASVAGEDGYIEESSETSNVGGAINATGTGTAAIRAGDQGLDRQFKSIVSFDTSTIPDGATVTFAQLQLKVAQAPTGTSPYSWTGSPICQVDIKNGGFGTSTALESGDFEAAASATNVVSGGMPNAALNAWSNGTLQTSALTQVNKTGKTQLRVFFTIDDNDNATPDYVGWYSSETPGSEPKFVVKYH